MIHYNWDNNELILAIRLQPRASRDEIIGPQQDWLKVRLTSPPVDGKANAQLLQFLAKQFGVAKSNIKLISGGTSRQKRVKIKAPARLPVEAKIHPSYTSTAHN